jgi:DNA-binding SARP family transcriptional activator
MSSLPPSNIPTISDWLRSQRSLVEAEKQLAQLAERYAAGQATLDELNELHEIVRAQRALAEAVLQAVLKQRPIADS